MGLMEKNMILKMPINVLKNVIRVGVIGKKLKHSLITAFIIKNIDNDFCREYYRYNYLTDSMPSDYDLELVKNLKYVEVSVPDNSDKWRFFNFDTNDMLSKISKPIEIDSKLLKELFYDNIKYWGIRHESFSSKHVTDENIDEIIMDCLIKVSKKYWSGRHIIEFFGVMKEYEKHHILKFTIKKPISELNDMVKNYVKVSFES